MVDRKRLSVGLLIVAAVVALGLATVGRSPTVIAATPTAGPVPAPAPFQFSTVENFLQGHCVECHNAKTQKGDISLHQFHDEASVLKDRKLLEDALEKVRAGEMPPKKKPRPLKAETDAFVHAVEGIFYRHDLTAGVDPGHVTVRRLNRTEYNNTIRDLCGVDFRPADDFPSDDVGFGFDNIGDVLSLSPVLLERYLAAAEMVMDRAIPTQPLPPLKHYLPGRQLEPLMTRRELPETAHRVMKVGQPVYTNFDAPDEADFVLHWRVYPDKPDDEGSPGIVALQVDGKQVDTYQVMVGQRKKPTVLESTVHLHEGSHRIALVLLKPWENDPGWKLRLSSFQVDGPGGMRPVSERLLLKVDPSLSKTEQTRQILARFASRAYRRPANSEEVDRLAALAADGESQSGKWESGISLAMQAVLVSPKFLYRLELDSRPDSTSPHPLDEFQLASRLSYFIWSTMPDEELSSLAAKNQLTANLEPQVRRMLKDPRASSLVDNFAMQWLQLRRLKGFSPDAQAWPEFDEELRAAMYGETSRFIASIIQEDRSILDLIDADYTFLNEPLSRLYNIGDTNGNPRWGDAVAPRGQVIEGPQFLRVHLADRQRGGVLTQASVLCVTSNPTRTSPVKRGKFVLDQILGVPPPPPPPNVPELKADAAAAATASLRQRMEQHRKDPMCASCHEQMDGIGFAFENFDAIGKYRWKDGNFDIDASGATPDGSSFKGVAELKTMLAKKKDLFSRCLTKKLMTYALGRGVEYYDQRAVDQVSAALLKENYRFSTLVTEIAKSDPFRLRRGKEQTP